MRIVNVPLGPRSYPIRIGSGLLATLGDACARAGLGGTCAIVSDSNVAPLYGRAAWEALAHVASRVGQVQERIGRRLLLENPSTYVGFKDSTMAEWEFLSELSRRSGCGILLDLNNVYVSARNFGFDPIRYLDGIPASAVGYFHLAGHAEKGKVLLDTHDGPVPAPVWDLYREALRRFGRVSTLVEWDDRIPPLEEVVAESRRAAAVEAEVLAQRRLAS